MTLIRKSKKETLPVEEKSFVPIVPQKKKPVHSVSRDRKVFNDLMTKLDALEATIASQNARLDAVDAGIKELIKTDEVVHEEIEEVKPEEVKPE